MDQKDFEKIMEKLDVALLKMSRAERQYKMALQDLKNVIQNWRQENERSNDKGNLNKKN